MKSFIALIFFLFNLAPVIAQTDDYYVDLGDSRIKESNFEGAIVAYSKAIEINSNNTRARTNRAALRMLSGDYEGAISDWNVSIKLDPSSWGDYVNRGSAKLYLGDYRGVLSDGNKAIQLNPSSASAYLVRGKANLYLSNFSDAINDFNSTLDFIEKINAMGGPDASSTANTTLFEALLHRGLAAGYSGNHRLAFADYDLIIKYAPDYADVYVCRGLLYIELGHIDKGCWDLSKAGELGRFDAYQMIKENCQ
jgi:tetratricopeptide (TPR) repeat protein